MLGNNYKGESPAKKLLRYRYWIEVRDVLEGSFYTGRHLVLASHEGGDVSTLLGLGVDPRAIVAVEADKASFDMARDKYRDYDITFVHGNAFDVKGTARKKSKRPAGFVSAFFDFCSPASHKLLTKVIRWTKVNLKSDAVLGVEVLRGRERDEEVKKRLSDFKAFREGTLEEREWDEWAKTLPRADVLESMLSIQALKTGFLLFPEWSGAYQSKTEGNNGVPMLAVLLRVWKPLSPKSRLVLAKKFSKEMRVDLDRGTIKGGLRTRMQTVTEKDLREIALTSCDEGEDTTVVAQLLNIPTQRLAAWKAHRTMGTYTNEAKGH